MIKFKRTDFFPQKDSINIKSLNLLLNDNLIDFKLENNFDIKNISSLENIHNDSIIFANQLLDLKLSSFNICILTNNKLNFNEKYKNIFLVKDGTLMTPELTCCLNGITRRSVIQIALDNNLSVQERSLTRDELYTADELFFCGSAVEITPIKSVDRLFGGSSTFKLGSWVKEYLKWFIWGLIKTYKLNKK